MKYIPDRRQNCRPQRIRRIRNQPTSAKPTSVKRKTLATHSRLVNHSVDQLIDSINPPSFGPTQGRRLRYAVSTLTGIFGDLETEYAESQFLASLGGSQAWPMRQLLPELEHAYDFADPDAEFCVGSRATRRSRTTDDVRCAAPQGSRALAREAK